MNAQSGGANVSSWSILWGVLLIILGILAIGSPLLAAVAVTALIAWLLIFAGFDHFIYGFHAKRAGNISAGSVIWEILVAFAYVAIGIYLLIHRLRGVASLTLLLALLFFVEGILDIIGYFQGRRKRRGSAWILIDGIITLLLGGLIWVHWPSSSLWAIGTLVGVSMIASGVARVIMSLRSRRLAVSTVSN